ncbi:hypothetical protein [Armatimonas sp.]|uniref:hypothetical protein n=1 Tax=Armatimonas sp. TaxID=1872638 RepID=UPI00286AC3DE|nr:hypothetical protein [Armatimonas sp.]
MTAAPIKETRRQTKLLGWQGFTLRVPDDWDLTGFSGSYDEGYLRVDDGEEQGLELKWATEPKKTKKPLDIEVRAESYLASLGRAAKKKRLAFDSELIPVPRGVQRPGREGFGFKWTGDKKAFGALWHCKETRRVVIAQVVGDRSGRKGLAGVSEGILASIENKDAEPGWRFWSLYDLQVELPSRFKLASQQLMNVYLRLSLADGMERVSVEQWAVANVARKDAYLDAWLEQNARGELAQVRYQADEASVCGHEAVAMQGSLAFGAPWVQAFRELLSLRVPATRFSARAWHCEPSNKIYLLQSLRPFRASDSIEELVSRMECHV